MKSFITKAIIWSPLLGILCSLLTVNAQNGIVREFYPNITLGTLAALTNNASFPNSPSTITVLDEFEAPQNVGDRYGQRLRGFVNPPITGSYIFAIAADQEAALYLSSDDSPANKLQIAAVRTATPLRNFDTDSAQRSAPVFLQAGRYYYIEALMAELTGDDHLTVRWELPDRTVEEPISGEHLFAEITGPLILTQPASVKVKEGETATFSVRVGNLGTVGYQWERNGVPIPGATNASLVLPSVGAADDGALFRVTVTNLFGRLVSAEALLSVERDLVAPAVVSVVNQGDNDILTIGFSKLLDPASATDVANYLIEPGVQVLEATLAGDGRSVILRTSDLTFGSTYTLSFTNILDRASIPNAVDPTIQKTFTLSFVPLDPGIVYGRPESNGPSSRRTPIAISEIMYHPAARPDGKDVEYVELYNSGLIVENVGGYRLAGAVDFTLPPGAFIPANGYLVIAPTPSDIQTVYGSIRVYGGFTNRLGNGGGTLKLYDNHGALLLDAQYGSGREWPVAADGAGHALVLARPSYGQADPRAYAPGQQIGGTPGRAEPVVANPYRALVINEVLANPAVPGNGYVELYNYSAQKIDLSGVAVSDDPLTNKFKFPANASIAPFGWVALLESDLGFTLSPAGGRIFVWNPQRNKVIDALVYDVQPVNQPLGRFPDGSPLLKTLSAPTFGALNSRWARPEVVINEIMYHPISGDDHDEYLELFNRSGRDLDLTNWRLTGGISFTFPARVLKAGEYLVVAADAARLLTNYAQLNTGNTLGNFRGSLSNKGERLALERLVSVNTPAGLATAYSLVDEVDYREGGRWGRWSDGGGSSLELIDPDSDNDFPSRWADSDETKKSSWTSITATGSLDNGNPAFPPANLHVLLEGAGEALLDNVGVFASSKPSQNLIANSTFENGTNNWVAQGTHEDSSLEKEGFTSKQSYRIRATARGDTAANRIRVKLAATMNTNDHATIRAQARWLAGNPEILLRIHGNWMEAAGRLDVPRNLGTPGAPNSRLIGNAGPSIDAVSHSPILPAPRQNVTVSCRMNDSDRLAFATLLYRVDTNNTYVRVNMNYSGAGYYSATIPGQNAGAIASFYIEATDIRQAVSRFPAEAPQKECVVVFGDTQLNGPVATYHMWLTQTNIDRWTNRERPSNKALDSTFVYNNERVIYNVGALYSGSPFHWQNYNGPLGIGCNYLLQFRPDETFLGDEDVILNLPSNANSGGGSDPTAVREQTVYWLMKEMGLPYTNRRYAYVFLNGIRRQIILEDAQQPNGEVVHEFYPNDPDGDLYKIEDWFEFQDNFTFSNVDATLEDWRDRDGKRKRERYRWNWRKRALQGKSAHDYTTLYGLSDALNDPNQDAYVNHVLSTIDADEWLGVQAMRHLVGDWDSYGYRRGKNMYAYKPEHDKWQLLNWDIAFAFALGDPPTQSLFSDTHSDGTLDRPTDRMYNTPALRRIYLRAIQKAMAGPFQAGRIESILDTRYNALLAAGIPVTGMQAVKDWITQRRVFVASQLAPLALPFAVTSNNGGNFSTTKNQIAVSGTAPLEARSIIINGVNYPVVWTTVNNWTARYALQNPSTSLTIQAADENGALLTGATKTITVNYTGATEQAQDRVLVDEIYFHATEAGTEFVELHNTSPAFAFDLSGYRLNGVDFTFPAGTILPPSGFLVVAADIETFVTRYGRGPVLAGEYSGNLDKGGETLSLISPAGAVVDAITFNDAAPWPSEADGLGLSLQVKDVSSDSSRVGNWAAATPTPGATNSVQTVLGPLPTIWLNELQPNNITGPVTGSGAHSSWVELYNNGGVTIDLSQLWLSDDYTNLTKWQFPASASLPTNSFLMVWLDGQAAPLELHANFRPAAASGSIVLSTVINGQAVVLDYLNYGTLEGNRSIGYYPDGSAGKRVVFIKPTPGGPNDPLALPPLFINEWMAANTRTIVNPLNGKYDDWIELYNAGSETINLAGFGLGDRPTNNVRFVFPEGAAIAPHGFVLVWADGENVSTNTSGQFHANFKLGQDGETIVLRSPAGGSVDVVTFGQQMADVSQGRNPDGAAGQFVSFTQPTPGASNIGSDPNALRLRASADAGKLILSWKSAAGAVYVLESKQNLADAAWSTVTEIAGNGSTLTVQENIDSSRRFYRLIQR